MPERGPRLKRRRRIRPRARRCHRRDAVLVIPCFARVGGHGAAGIIAPSGIEICADLLHLDVGRRPRLVATGRVQPYGAVIEQGSDDIRPPIFRNDLLAADRAADGEADDVVVGHASVLHRCRSRSGCRRSRIEPEAKCSGAEDDAAKPEKFELEQPEVLDLARRHECGRGGEQRHAHSGDA